MTHNYSQNIQKVFSNEIPSFMLPFLQSKSLNRLKDISQNCGLDYTKLYNKLPYSRFEHSINVALIIWKFTQSKEQALSWLFHDISNTTFSHVWDFLLWDAEKQESSEIYGNQILSNDPLIIEELNKLNISIDKVDEYKLYPIADNNLPQLSADRLEYNLSNPILTNTRTIQDIKTIYDDIIILKNEKQNIELWFQNKELAIEFWLLSIENDESSFSSYESVCGMHFLSHILQKLIQKKYLNHIDLYTLQEKEIVNLIYEKNDLEILDMRNYYTNLHSYKISRYYPKTDNFFVSSKCKKRYVDPLIKTSNWNIRVSSISKEYVQKRDYNLNRATERIILDYKFNNK